METKHWYAVQETENDAWDYGSYSHKEAFEMAMEIAKENGIAYIAYIDEEYLICDAVEFIDYIDGEFVITLHKDTGELVTL